MAGLHANDQRAVVIGIKLGPIYGDDNVGLLSDHAGTSIVEQMPDIELGVGQQAINRLRPLAKERPLPMAWMASEPDPITSWVALASDNTRLACKQETSSKNQGDSFLCGLY